MGRNYQTLPESNAKMSEDITRWNDARVQVQAIADTAMQSALAAMKS